MELQQEISLENEEKVGRVFKVLIDKRSWPLPAAPNSDSVGSGIMKSSSTGGRKLAIGEFVHVRITRAFDYDLEGEVVD